MEFFTISRLLGIVQSELHNLPFEFLQAFAMVGVFAILLQLQEVSLSSKKRPSWSLGVTLGGACFLFRFFLVQHMGEVSFPTSGVLTTIFLAGVIGGWVNGGIAFTISLASYVLIGTSDNTLMFSLNYLGMAIMGSLAHTVFVHKQHSQITAGGIALLIVWRFIAAELSTTAFWMLDLIETTTIPEIFIKRMTSSFTVSALIIIAMMLLLRQAMARDHLLHTDPGTGFGNRRALQKRLNECLLTKKATAPHTLLLFNLDNYSEVIQTYGHLWMDAFNRTYADVLRNMCNGPALRSFSPQAFVFSEQSVAIILAGATKTDLEENGLPQRLFTELCLNIQSNEKKLHPTFTLSVIEVCRTEGNTPIRFLRTLNLLEKQQSGKVQFFEPDITQQVVLEEKVHGLINHWLSENTAPVWLQPKIDLHTGLCYGAEALLRTYANTSTTHVNPHVVFTIADKFRLSQKLNWVIVSTVVEMIKNLPTEMSNLKISVNLTPDMLTDSNFAHNIIALLNEQEVNPKQLILEIIETHKLSPSEAVQKNVRLLTNQGIWLSLDDFGTGYSSLGLLAQFPFKELKLDYSMTSRSHEPRISSAIELAVASAKNYQAHIVAEGIETQEQYDKMLDIDVPYGQGYLFGKAMPLEDFVSFVSKEVPAKHKNVQDAA